MPKCQSLRLRSKPCFGPMQREHPSGSKLDNGSSAQEMYVGSYVLDSVTQVKLQVIIPLSDLDDVERDSPTSRGHVVAMQKLLAG